MAKSLSHTGSDDPRLSDYFSEPLPDMTSVNSPFVTSPTTVFSPVQARSIHDGSDSGITTSSPTSMFSYHSDNGNESVSHNILHVPPHPRSSSGLSGRLSQTSFLSEGGKSEDPLVFVEEPNKTLFCNLCNKVLNDPVITSCGHSFCKRCVRPDVTCPTDRAQLNILAPNLAVSEQVGGLLIHCRYGCKLSEDGSGYVVDSSGCPGTCKLNSRKDHEDNCDYAPVQCPNNPHCPILIKKDLNDHIKSCNHVKCPHHKHGCEFHGTQEEFDIHLHECKFEGMKDFIQRTDDRLTDLAEQVADKDEQIDFLRAILSTLSERFERLEKDNEMKLNLLGETNKQITSELVDNRRDIEIIHDELNHLGGRLNMSLQMAGAFDPQQIFKCRGTFVGHQGPVWCLCVHGDFLLSGSSDKTVKVWDTTTNYKCIKTLDGHNGIVLTICVFGNKLYSGSQDCSIVVWNMDTFEKITSIEAHDNPVCTLVSARNMLFSGSLKCIKVWDVHNYQLKKEITGLNHWVRALVASQNHLYSGSYQTIKIWDLETLECVRNLETSGGSVYSIAITSHHILCGTYENCIHVWELDGFQQITTLMGHNGTVYALAALQTPSGTKVFSASYDRSLRHFES
ncbi:unnamed protein product [Owenia fusiformis]|uniref:Uncharacterized protein n=1 Tax=Owenia fusiformis TaxID=6347 RepID=A0A8S4PSA5_OWEFU|nr:unnamed protein product [Owenia fusiformis]